MSDVIWGDVKNIVDGDTFDLKVTHVGKNNVEKYNNEERIRIEDVNAPEIPSAAGKRSKDALEKKLLGKYVRCDIRARDTYGRLVCKVSLAIKPT
ncbi:hypothetical protein J7M23_06855 [Candidatus Sumerlaeota bacterium]|nr:hypothetical protein [Candidatus Sumerlaeota bacterium]